MKPALMIILSAGFQINTLNHELLMNLEKSYGRRVVGKYDVPRFA